jgi:hypothetical protein
MLLCILCLYVIHVYIYVLYIIHVCMYVLCTYACIMYVCVHMYVIYVLCMYFMYYVFMYLCVTVCVCVCVRIAQKLMLLIVSLSKYLQAHIPQASQRCLWVFVIDSFLATRKSIAARCLYRTPLSYSTVRHCCIGTACQKSVQFFT